MIKELLIAATSAAAGALITHSTKTLILFILITSVLAFIYLCDRINEKKKLQDKASIERLKIDFDSIRQLYTDLTDSYWHEYKNLNDAEEIEKHFNQEENKFQNEETKRSFEKYCKSLNDLIKFRNGNFFPGEPGDRRYHLWPNKNPDRDSPSPEKEQEFFDSVRELNSIVRQNQEDFESMIRTWKRLGLI